MPDPIELRRLLDEATPTPWELAFRDPAMNGEHWVTRHQGRPGICIAGFSYGHASGDADLVAAAVNALPELLDAAEALERVKVLHHPTPAPTSMHYHCEPSECDQAGDGELRDECDNCREWYPCSTIRAIDGEPQP